MWNLRVQGSALSLGWTNRAGKQEAAGAAGPGVKGSGGGRGVAAGLSPGMGSAASSSPPPGGCVPTIVHCANWARAARERTEGSKRCKLASDSQDPSTQEMSRPTVPSHSKEITSHPPFPSPTKAEERRLWGWELPGGGCPVAPRLQVSETANISKQTLGTNPELPTFNLSCKSITTVPQSLPSTMTHTLKRMF